MQGRFKVLLGGRGEGQSLFGRSPPPAVLDHPDVAFLFEGENAVLAAEGINDKLISALRPIGR